ncbi:MAG: hypothetical protein ACXAEU_12885 [Candidatus Hodarchaeales archaeon]|jgi:hypothetical protein
MEKNDLEKREKDNNLESCLFCEILDRIREANPDFPIDFVLHYLPDHEEIPHPEKNFLIGVVACLAAIWTERVMFKNKPKRLKGEEWEEITSQEFIKMLEKISKDFKTNPDLTHRAIAYIDASNVYSKVFYSYLDREYHDWVIRVD